MFRIGEFSKLARVSPRMLRHYDKCGLFCPAEIDRRTGYRMYSAEQIPKLTRIIELRDMGFGVEEIEGMLPHYKKASYMHRALEQKQKEINAVIRDEQDKLDNIAALSSTLKKEQIEMIYEVELKSLPSVEVLSLREVIRNGRSEDELWGRMSAFVDANGVDRVGIGENKLNGYFIYHDEEYKENDCDVEIAVPVSAKGGDKDGFTYRTLEAIPEAATIRFSGAYTNYGAAVEKLAAWMEAHGYIFRGIMRGMTITGPQNDADESDYLTELQLPTRKA